MKKIVKSTKELPAFSMNIKEFKSFWLLLERLFENTSELTQFIDVKIQNEKIEFRSIDDFMAYDGFNVNLTDFYLSMSSGEKRIGIYTSKILNRIATVSVSSDDELWTAGATETIRNYLTNHKVWYSWIVRLPLMSVLITLILIAMVVGLNLPKDYKIPHLIGYSLIGVCSVLFLLAGVRDKFLPGAKLLTLNDEIFYKRYVVELTLGLSLISAILAAVAVFN